MKTITLVRREDGREGPTLDVTGWNERELDRLWDGLVMKVDFAEWMPVYSPDRGEDETLGEWVCR